MVQVTCGRDFAQKGRRKYDGETSDLVFRARSHIVFCGAKLFGC